MSAITAQDVIDWGSLNTGDVLSPGIVERCLRATIDFVSKRYALLGAESDEWADDAQLAVIMQAARLYKRRRSPEGVAGFGDMGVVRISRLDPDVADLLAAYQVLRVNGAPDDRRLGSGEPIDPDAPIFVRTPDFFERHIYL